MPKKTYKRERQCVIESKTLEDILATCDRNIRNISMTLMDTLQEGDDTPADHFYCNHYRGSWEDLRDDVLKMLEKQKGPAPAEVKVDMKYHAYIIQGTEHERGWGQRPDGVVAFATEEQAEVWIKNYYKRHHTSTSTPDEYTVYDKVGIQEVSFETFKKIDGQHAVHANYLKDLQ